LNRAVFGETLKEEKVCQKTVQEQTVQQIAAEAIVSLIVIPTSLKTEHPTNL
jgi:hypothetical protein